MSDFVPTREQALQILREAREVLTETDESWTTGDWKCEIRDEKGKDRFSYCLEGAVNEAAVRLGFVSYDQLPGENFGVVLKERHALSSLSNELSLLAVAQHWGFVSVNSLNDRTVIHGATGVMDQFPKEFWGRPTRARALAALDLRIEQLEAEQ